MSDRGPDWTRPRPQQLRRIAHPWVLRVEPGRKIADARARGLPVACEVCGFNFAHTYGPRGTDYIEVHHRTPLHVTGPTRTTLADLALICSNCHRMIHRTDPWLTVEQLHDLVADRRSAAHRTPQSAKLLLRRVLLST